MMNDRSVLVWPEGPRHERLLFTGRDVSAAQQTIALDMVEHEVPETPQAWSYRLPDDGDAGVDGDMDPDSNARLLMLPFTMLNGMVVVLFAD